MKLQLALLEAEWFSPEARAALHSHFAVTEFGTNPSISSILSGFEIVVLRLSVRISESDIPATIKCRLVAVPATGLDHIAVSALKSRGIDVIGLKQCRGSIEGISATAELTVGLLLSLVRRIPAAANAVAHHREWNRNDFRGTQLSGRTAGIIGLGRIGMKVARILQAFEMNVIYFDTNPLVDGTSFQRTDSLSDLLTASDVILLHTSIDHQTLPILGRRELEACKHGAFIVNTARGQLLDSLALVELLEQGRLSGAALDVVQGEPDRIPQFLFDHAAKSEELILTPHIGGNTFESVQTADMVLVDELVARYAT